MARIRVEPSLAGRRLDATLAAALPGLTVRAARRLIAEGRVRVDGRRMPKGERVAAGAVLEIEDGEMPGPGAGLAEAGPVPDAALPLTVLHADPALVAVDKPAGVPSHPLRAGEVGTAANAIVALFPECASVSPARREGGLVHRLDRDTSGVLVAARSAEVWPLLRAALRGAACTKAYLAEVVGAPPAQAASDAPIGRVGRRGARVRVDGGRAPLPASTAWRVLEQRDGTALVRAELHAGRAHQVRAHLAAAGWPILGDATYGDEASRALAVERGVERLRLHAASIAFQHPTTGRPILIAAPPPGWAILRAPP